MDSQSTTAAAAGGAAASESVMEEEVTEPDPQPSSPIPPGLHSEVNGDLPGHPYLRQGLLEMMESPERDPAALRDSAEYGQSHQRG